MKKKYLKSMIVMLLLCSQLIGLSACTKPQDADAPVDISWFNRIQAVDLMKNIEPEFVSPLMEMDEGNLAVTDFAVRLMQQSTSAQMEDGKNTLISPLSVIYALAMTTNGANGDTLAQMEDVLGLDIDELNQYLYTYMKDVNENEKCKLTLANSIWLRDSKDLSVKEEFLQINANYYRADIYKDTFGEDTVDDINKWVKKKTDGTIPKIIDSIGDRSHVFLINALLFDSEWSNVYEKKAVSKGTFRLENGTEQDVELMYDDVYSYLEDEYATGMMKFYKGNFAFVALLPNEGVSVEEYLASLSGEHVKTMLENVQNVRVKTWLPKFETEYESDMEEILKHMGMRDAFDYEKADFTGLGTLVTEIGAERERNLSIEKVLHKTYIKVDTRGTKAGAVTSVEMADGADNPEFKPKEVRLDRPFIYMIVDCEHNIPIFMGTLMGLNG